jgi:hypothetical protein
MDYLKTSKCVPCYRKLGGAKVLSGSLEDVMYVDLLHIVHGAGLFLFSFVVPNGESNLDLYPLSSRETVRADSLFDGFEEVCCWLLTGNHK